MAKFRGSRSAFGAPGLDPRWTQGDKNGVGTAYSGGSRVWFTLSNSTPLGSCWRRYSYDGYGQRDDGGPFQWEGRGRGWPLLTGERGHYELAAGRDCGAFIRAMGQFATPTGLLTEQVWDGPDLPGQRLTLGRPTGAAMPLMWAHAEYIKLLRSAADSQVIDFVPEAADRYCSGKGCRPIEVWKPTRKARAVRRGMTLRIQAPAAFRLHWSLNDWQDTVDTPSAGARLGIDFVDIPIATSQRAPVSFTFLWTGEQRWEARDYEVAIIA